MRYLTSLAVAFAVLSLTGICCHNASQDSGEAAKDSNAVKIDSGNSANRPVSEIPATVTKDDSKFVVNAAEGGMMEVQLGQLAQQMGVSGPVKSFGAMMERDHSRAGDRLKALAQDKQLTLPAALSPDMQKKMDDLKNSKNFDKDYITLMVKDHKDDIKEFDEESKKGSDTAIRNFAGSSLPMLHMHLDSAESCQKTLKKS